MKMRDLIRAVRSCKTAAEERAVISKECALIRTAIKEEDEAHRYRNVAKLMYIHMLGYPTHFGQMECLKLISAQTFPEKRLGYLALTLLMNEQNEVLTLVTNSLKLDLTNQLQYIQGLALIVIGNLATQDMARDLASDVDKLLRSNNSYLRKKAALAAIRLLKKEPDLIESLAERIVALLKDRAHGVLLTGIQLMMDVLDMLPHMKEEYVKLVPSLVRLLRNFISMGFSPEHDVSGITDPFMQVKLLRILRLLGKGNEEASEQMNDVLAQVATNTETAKNAGNAILYECVQTIMDVQSDSSLRVLAVNILGRFLLNRDNNIRYVALNSLSRVVTEDIAAVQRHRATIVDCLKDADISIRQRALELIYQLVNESNVVSLTAELLNYLIVAQSDQKASLSSKIMQIVEKYAPSKKWRIDTIITMVSVAGNQAEETVVRTAILFIAQCSGYQGYATHKLYRNLLEDTSQLGLLFVGIWCIGEFGDLLSRDVSIPGVQEEGPIHLPSVSESDVIQLIDRCMRLHNADNNLKSIGLNALIKLSTRFTSAQSQQSLLQVLKPFKNSMSLELQQRSVEYSNLLINRWDGIRGELLGKMPIIDEAVLRKRRQQRGEMSSISDDNNMSPSANTINMPVGGFGAPKANNSKGGGDLLDLDDIFGGSSTSTASVSIPQNNLNSTSSAGKSNEIDLLSDIFSAPNPTPSVSSTGTSHVASQHKAIDDIFGNLGLGANQAPITPNNFQTPMNPMGMNMNMTSMNMNMNMSSMPMAPMQSLPVNIMSPTIPTITAFEKNGFKVCSIFI